MAIKYYAVRKGKAVGIYMTWDECKRQVHGFAGAEYKSFPELQAAKDYLVSGGNKETGPVSGDPGVQAAPPLRDENRAIAYTDGSYHAASHEYACGAVLFYGGQKILFSKKYNDPVMADMRNVAGEIMGAVEVIEYCVENNIPALEIRHDYEGVGKWAMDEWKTNKEGTRQYAAFCKSVADRLQLSFVHVKGHSGDQYNDEADALARKALGI